MATLIKKQLTGRMLMEILEKNGLMDSELTVASQGYVFEYDGENSLAVSRTIDGRVMIHDNCGSYYDGQDDGGIVSEDDELLTTTVPLQSPS